MSLKLNPGKLITTGLWKHLRNPNYFGELLIYSSFLILSTDLYAFLVLGTFVVGVWLPNMRAKEKSLSRYPEFQHYKENSWYFIPFIY
jgi:steroid 5-alpha reductase family enzyme